MFGLSKVSKAKKIYDSLSPVFQSLEGWTPEKKLPENIVVHNKQIVPTITLDSYHFEDIDFIKLDCDSHEGYILAGAEQFFKTNSPVVLIENKKSILKDRQPENMPNAIELLDSYGYVLAERVEKNDFVYLKGAVDAK